LRLNYGSSFPAQFADEGRPERRDLVLLTPFRTGQTTGSFALPSPGAAEPDRVIGV
jgi:hypothetical protein